MFSSYVIVLLMFILLIVGVTKFLSGISNAIFKNSQEIPVDASSKQPDSIGSWIRKSRSKRTVRNKKGKNSISDPGFVAGVLSVCTEDVDWSKYDSPTVQSVDRMSELVSNRTTRELRKELEESTQHTSLYDHTKDECENNDDDVFSTLDAEHSFATT